VNYYLWRVSGSVKKPTIRLGVAHFVLLCAKNFKISFSRKFTFRFSKDLLDWSINHHEYHRQFAYLCTMSTAIILWHVLKGLRQLICCEISLTLYSSKDRVCVWTRVVLYFNVTKKLFNDLNFISGYRRKTLVYQNLSSWIKWALFPKIKFPFVFIATFWRSLSANWWMLNPRTRRKFGMKMAMRWKFKVLEFFFHFELSGMPFCNLTAKFKLQTQMKKKLWIWETIQLSLLTRRAEFQG